MINHKHLQKIVGKSLYYSRAVDATIFMAMKFLEVIKTNTTVDTASKTDNPFIELLCITSICSDGIQYEWHDSKYLLWCFLHVWTRYVYQNRQVFFFLYWYQETIIQYRQCLHKFSNTCGMQCNAQRHGRCHRSWIGQIFRKFSKGHLNVNRPTINGLPAINYPSGNRKLCRDYNFERDIQKMTSRSINMIFSWVRDWVSQNDFKLSWEEFKITLTDYFTKHHPICYRRTMCQTICNQCWETKEILNTWELFLTRVFQN